MSCIIIKNKNEIITSRNGFTDDKKYNFELYDINQLGGPKRNWICSIKNCNNLSGQFVSIKDKNKKLLDCLSICDDGCAIKFIDNFINSHSML